MVRIIAPPIESGYDTEVPMRADVDPEMFKDAVKAQTSTGYRDRVLLPLHYNPWGCGGVFLKWGFDDSYPVLLRRHLPIEDWKYALSRIHTGYIGSLWPKMVWAPFWTLMIVGAILEGACHMSDAGVPVGTLISCLTATGLLVSLILIKVSYGMLQRDLERIQIVCSLLTEQYRENYVTFDLVVGHGNSRIEARLDVKVHVDDVDVQHITLDVDKFTGAEDKHMVYVDTSGERVVVYSTGTSTHFQVPRSRTTTDTFYVSGSKNEPEKWGFRGVELTETHGLGVLNKWLAATSG